MVSSSTSSSESTTLKPLQDLITYTVVELNPLRVNEASVAEGDNLHT